MNISLNWLKDFIDINLSTEELSHKLTMSGLEVESVDKYEQVRGSLEGIVIGQVLDCQRHPDADKLSVTLVDLGTGEPAQIVCGAPNVAKGQKVVVATIGTTLYPQSGEPFKIKKSKIRGVESNGMICAEDEIGLGTSHAGIIVLDTTLPNGTPASQYFKLEADYTFAIGLTPNRVDAASHYGVARDLKAILKSDIKKVDTTKFTIDNQALDIKIEVQNSEACPRYAGLTINNVSVKDSPDWLKNRLKSIGLSPINNIVDITNFVLHHLGQPLHAFDYQEIKGKKIIVKTLDQNTPFVTLDGKERKLSSKDLMICNAEEPMCLAGIFGGLHSGVSEKTTSIFLESAYFSPTYIRTSSQFHGLKTDASFRFERGTDPEMVITALKFAALLIKEIAGGQISSSIIDLYAQPIPAFDVLLKYKNVDRLIGKVIDRQEIKRILDDLDIKIINENEHELALQVPAYRVDVQREADVIEDILRIFGYESVIVNEHLHTDFLANFPEKDKDFLQSKITELLASSGANEIITNSLTRHEYAEMLKDLDQAANVQIMNVLSADLDVMRQSMLFSGLEVILHNINRRQKNLRLFEFGKTYRKLDKSYKENSSLTIFVSGDKQEESWQNKTQSTDFHTLATLVNQVLQKLGKQKYESMPLAADAWAYGLAYQQGNQVFAKLGLVRPDICRKLGIKQEVFYAELDWDFLVSTFKSNTTYQEIPKFPEVRRDLSLVMDKKITFESIKSLAFKTERALLRQMNVFDVYEGENLGGKKSYSVSFTLQDDEKTLTDALIDKTMNKLMEVFEKELAILIRK